MSNDVKETDLKDESGVSINFSSKVINSMHNDVNDVKKTDVTDESVSNIIDQYQSVFHGIGKLKDVKVKLYIDEKIKPVAQKHRRIPFHLREKVENEIKRLLDADVIERVDEPTAWISPLLWCQKRVVMKYDYVWTWLKQIKPSNVSGISFLL